MRNRRIRRGRERRKRWWVAAIVLAVLAIFFLRVPILQAFADFLVIETTPEKSDVVIVLGGEKLGERTKKAVSVYKSRMAEQILFSDGTNLSWRVKSVNEMTALARLLGVPEEDIFIENISRSTYENAVATRKILTAQGWTSAIVVTTDWHSRRSRFVFERVYNGSGIRLTYASTTDPLVGSLEAWWRDAEKQQLVLTEWGKLVVYWLKWGF